MRDVENTVDREELTGAIFQPSPLDRDPEVDGDDYGCCDDEGNAQVAMLVDDLIDQIATGSFHDGDDLIEVMRRGLKSIGDEATDTIVKENVRNTLLEAVDRAALRVNWGGIYGW